MDLATGPKRRETTEDTDVSEREYNYLQIRESFNQFS